MSPLTRRRSLISMKICTLPKLLTRSNLTQTSCSTRVTIFLAPAILINKSLTFLKELIKLTPPSPKMYDNILVNQFSLDLGYSWMMKMMIPIVAKETKIWIKKLRL